MNNYSPRIPRDKTGEPLQHVVSEPALAQYSSENASSSSVISVTHDTTALEISAVGGAAVMRWVTTGDSQASVVSGATGENFDYSIPADTVRRFVIPQETEGLAQGSAVGVNRGEGLYQRVAYKTVGVASILATEY